MTNRRQEFARIIPSMVGTEPVELVRIYEEIELRHPALVDDEVERLITVEGVVAW